jgi:hypothetical protein
MMADIHGDKASASRMTPWTMTPAQRFFMTSAAK